MELVRNQMIQAGLVEVVDFPFDCQVDYEEKTSLSLLDRLYMDDGFNWASAINLIVDDNSQADIAMDWD